MRGGVELPAGPYGHSYLYQVLRACERVGPERLAAFLALPAQDQQALLAYSLVRDAEDHQAAARHPKT